MCPTRPIFSIRLKIPEYKRTILAMKTLFHTGVTDSYYNPLVLRVSIHASGDLHGRMKTLFSAFGLVKLFFRSSGKN